MRPQNKFTSNGGFSTPKCTYIDSGCVWIFFWVYNHQRCQVPKMEVLTYVSCMSGLCKGKPIPRIAENKVHYLHFRHLKCLVIQLLKHPVFLQISKVYGGSLKKNSLGRRRSWLFGYYLGSWLQTECSRLSGFQMWCSSTTLACRF